MCARPRRSAHEFQHPPAVSARGTDAETGSEVFKQRRRQTFGEYIRELTGARNLKNAKFTNGYLLPNEVDVDLDVFGSPVMDGVASHVHTGDVVAVGHRRLRNGVVKLAKKLSEPRALSHRIGDATVLRLRG